MYPEIGMQWVWNSLPQNFRLVVLNLGFLRLTAPIVLTANGSVVEDAMCEVIVRGAMEAGVLSHIRGESIPAHDDPFMMPR